MPRLERPIFVVGAPRSGTTFLGSCLETLPEVSYHYEPLLTQWLVREREALGWGEPRQAALVRATYRWLLRVHGEGDLRFAEKTPRNAFALPFLARTFPDARFVHIVRDGRDVAVSLLALPWFRSAPDPSAKGGGDSAGFGPHARFWVEPERAAEFEAASDARRCAWCWRRYTEAVLEGFAALPAERALELRYETLAEAGDAAADALAAFLDVAAPESRARLRAAFGRARRDSVGGFARRLDPEERADVEAEAGLLLKRLGYV